ncbi:RNA polymerase sigma factor [Rhizosphaericola mali]|uniref:Sigma-70 family RNA polymerase sigma factor n=1 Tax=Rhizosphaericola mali TaxID=2545455 RepID=A0A5P2G8I1_9BACT|nr:sigma-70 family RNA polymerase sigma factor [Rhizosphaericola mali]QES89523.1 sigma-70 family RNA polymerase sigma factor [Rhizosphaericola mali]
MNFSNKPYRTDEEILFDFDKSKDNRLLGVLLQRYTLLLLGVCMKYLKNEEDAKDCVQLIFMKIIAYLPNNKVSNFKSWLYTVAKNQCFMYLRSKKSQVHAEEINDDILEEFQAFNFDADREYLLSLMETKISELPNGQKECIELFFLKKETYNEIVAHTEFTLLQVKSHIQNGKRNLKLMMEKSLNDSNR